MLDHTFIHIQGIGEKTERAIWSRGIYTWADFLEYPKRVFSEGMDLLIREELRDSILHQNEIGFFAKRLPASELWRLYEPFKGRVVYLDIETSGSYMGMDEITVIGIYDGCNSRSFLSGVDMQDFECAIAEFDLVVTFNGSCFDLPLIKRSFPNISLPGAHIDLRFPLKRLGYGGGLKRIEKETGIERGEEIEGMDGYDAVRLWKAYQWGDDRALEILLEYNRADVVNLKPLMKLVHEGLKARVFPYAE